MDNRPETPIKVKIVFDHRVPGVPRSKDVVSYLKEQGIACSVADTVKTYVISVHTRTKLLISIASHLEVMRVLAALDAVDSFKGKLRVISVSVHNMNEYKEDGSKQ